MKIQDNRQLKDLQADFKKEFPFLKIEFFREAHKHGIDSNEIEKLDVNHRVGDIRTIKTSGEMPLDGTMTTSIFESSVADNFGLNVQVYRKEHGKWLQTWVTDIWTLEEQNNRSKVMGDMDNLLGDEK